MLGFRLEPHLPLRPPAHRRTLGREDLCLGQTSSQRPSAMAACSSSLLLVLLPTVRVFHRTHLTLGFNSYPAVHLRHPSPFSPQYPPFLHAGPHNAAALAVACPPPPSPPFLPPRPLGPLYSLQSLPRRPL